MRSWKIVSWLSGMAAKPTSRRKPRRPSPVKLRLECLEERLVPTAFVVMDNSDLVTDANSLRFALANLAVGSAANTNTITFASNLAGQTITESAADGGTLAITQGVTISGPTANVTIDGANAVTVFSVANGITASLSSLTITNGNGLLGIGGGGILNNGTLTVINSTFSNNSAVNGGGIDNAGTLTVNASTFSGNSAGTGAGIESSGALMITNSTFSGNTGGVGGGVDSSATMTISDSTLSGNSAGTGSGINNVGGTATLNGDIIVGNPNSSTSNPDDLAGANIDPASSNNVVGVDGTTTLMDGMQGNQVGVTVAQAALAPLGAYGGSTRTFALLPGSFAIGKGQTGKDPNDQRGALRSGTARADAGAFQDQGYTLTSSNTPQSTNINTAFALPLVVTLTENFVHSPLSGAAITFAAPMSGASAALTSPLVTDMNGQTSVTATANNTPGGPYTVTASDAGADTTTFQLTNTNNEVLTGAVGDQLLVQQSSDGVVGDITYTVTHADNSKQTTNLTGVTSLTIQGAYKTVTIDFPANGQALVNGAISVSGAGALNLEANGLIVRAVPQAFRVANSQTVININVQSVHIDGAEAVDAVAGPDTADRDAGFMGLSANERFVQALYLAELGRAGKKSELDQWVLYLNSAGANAVASGIDHSFEARDHLVNSWYLNYLNRSAKGGEELGWVDLLLNGQTEEKVLSQILASTEFNNEAQTLFSSGTAQDRYVQALYHVLLNRTGEQPGAADWVSALPRLTAQGVALDFLTLPEFRIDDIEAYYNALLHRPDDSNSLNNYVFSNLNLAAVRADFEAGSEFFTNG